MPRRSFPSWERGLKPIHVSRLYAFDLVVPLVGTWIETSQLYAINLLSIRRSPRGNVD